MTTAVRATVFTHRGAVRATNEDALAVGPATVTGLSMRTPLVVDLPVPALVAVADGMGGHAAGDVAAGHAVRTLAAAAPGDAVALTYAAQRVDDDLLAMGRGDPAVAGLGTTVAGVLVTPDDAFHLGIGDSRVYVGYGSYLSQVSTDDRGAGGGLTRCLGGRAEREPLMITAVFLPPTDRVLLCSDGLSDLVADEYMEDLLRGSDTTTAVTALWSAAMDAGGRDNITIAVVEWVG